MKQIVAGLILACCSVILLAQPTSPPGSPETGADAEESTALTQERIEQLILTLESDTARQELIDNLKALLEHTEQESGEPEPHTVAELLNLDEEQDNIFSRFFQKMESLGFSQSATGNLILLGVSIIGILLVMLINHRLAHWVNGRMKSLRSRLRLPADRFTLLFKAQIWFGYAVGIFLILLAITGIYHPWPAIMKENLNIYSIINTTLVTLVVILIVVVFWELANLALEVWVRRNRRISQARLNTLLPIIRNVLVIVLVIMTTLVLLSEMGVDIVPLMAGAGVLGIAIGFGAQTMVKDFITGFIVIFEDQLQVGDIVTIAGYMGEVEKITVRKIQLRDLEGVVYTVPFGEVTTVANYTKDFSYYMLKVEVAYRENVDEVMACLKDIDEQLRSDQDYKYKILEPLEMLGVDEFADSAVVIKARIKTRAQERWNVGRAFNRLMKHAFDERHIRIPFPHRTLYFGEDRRGSVIRDQEAPEETESGKAEPDKNKA